MKTLLAALMGGLFAIVLYASSVGAQERPAWCSANQCRISAKSCSAARTQCYSIQNQCGASTAGCDKAHARCMSSGAWAGKVCNLSGLQRS
jgi:hypothetical protein